LSNINNSNNQSPTH